jgi:hypothetical protein
MSETLEPRTHAGRKFLKDMGLNRPRSLYLKERRVRTVRAILDIEYEAAGPMCDRLTEAVIALPRLVMGTGDYVDVEAVLDEIEDALSRQAEKETA